MTNLRRLLFSLAILVFASSAYADNYAVTLGSGKTFGSKTVTSVDYAQQLLCDVTTPSQCVAVNSSGVLSVGATQVGTWTIGVLGTTVDAPCTLPATTTGCSLVAVDKALANAANSPPPLGTTGGWSSTMTAALTSVTAIKASPGQVGELYCYNPNSIAAFVQVFNTASGSVTLGTTVPLRSYGIPPTAAGGVAMNVIGIQFSTAISYAATTTATGASLVSTGLTCNVSFN